MAPREYQKTKLSEKTEILKQVDSMLGAGVGWNEMERQLKIKRQTLKNWHKNRKKILQHVALNPTTNATAVSHRRNPIYEVMETILLAYIEAHAAHSCPLTPKQIQTEAADLVGNIEMQFYHNDSSKLSRFQGSIGWFKRFCRRHGLRHNVDYYGENELIDQRKVMEFVEEFKRIADDYHPHLIFTVDECGLFWKKIPTGFGRVDRRRITLLLGGNSSGMDRLPPMLVHTSEKPRALTHVNRDAERLGVLYRWNASAWITRDLFQDWFDRIFVPAVQQIASREGLEPKALLVLDSSPIHPKNLARDHPNIRVVYMPSNTSLVLQPMDHQRVIRSFKVNYLNRLMAAASTDAKKMKILKQDDSSSFRFSHFLKELNIRQAIEFVVNAWKQVKPATLHDSWRRIYPTIQSIIPPEEEDSIPVLSGDFIGEIQDLLQDVPPELIIDYRTLSNENLGFIHSNLERHLAVNSDSVISEKEENLENMIPFESVLVVDEEDEIQTDESK